MSKPARKKELGQALVETAITMPILILILSGLLDLGRVYYTYIALEEAAAEAALYLAVNSDCATATEAKCSDPNNALYRASTAGNQEFDASNVEWNIPYTAAKSIDGFIDPFRDCGGSFPVADVGTGCVVIIQLRYDYDFITPGIESIANSVSGGNGLTLEVQATQIVIFD